MFNGNPTMGIGEIMGTKEPSFKVITLKCELDLESA
jgi:hypothetical protein